MKIISWKSHEWQSETGLVHVHITKKIQKTSDLLSIKKLTIRLLHVHRIKHHSTFWWRMSHWDHPLIISIHDTRGERMCWKLWGFIQLIAKMEDWRRVSCQCFIFLQVSSQLNVIYIFENPVQQQKIFVKGSF